MTDLLMMLAQTSQPAPPAGPPPSGTELFFRNIFPLFLIIGVFWWWISRGRSKERKRFENMLSSMQRNDRVQTIGGILGTVVEVRDDEVIVKVDETSNTKMRFNRGAIKEVIRDSQTGG